jgi:Lysyl oxidase/Immunoglobulin I-set domain
MMYAVLPRSLVPFLQVVALTMGIISTRTVSAQNIIFSDGFENGLVGWQTGDNNILNTPCYWGVVDAAFGGEPTKTGTNKAYCATIGYAGTVPAPLYQPNMSAYMLRPLNLTGYTNATLSFWYRIPTIEGGMFDFARVFIDETVVWTRAVRQAGAWAQAVISLENFVGSAHTLKFQFDSDESQQYEGMYLDDILVTDAYTPGPPPANDNFAASTAMPGAVGTLSGTTASGTFETGEPTGGFSETNSVWFRWTAITNGQVTFTTDGSAFDTILCLYTGSIVGALTPVACDDNGGQNGTSRVVFNATQGTIYRVQVRGANNSRGLLRVNWSQPEGVGYDLLPDIGLWASETSGYLFDWYIDRNEPTKPGRTLLRASTASINTGIGALEIRGSSQTNGLYQRIYSSDGGHRDEFIYDGVLTFHYGHGHLHFGDWLNFTLREVLPGNGVGDVAVAGEKTSFAIIDLVPNDLTMPGAPSSPRYGVDPEYSGLVQGMSVGWADVYSGTLLDQWIDITGITPKRYWLEASVDPEHRVIESNESNNVVRILIDLTYIGTTNVPNDNFTNAIVVTGPTGGFSGSNVGATKESGEPTHEAFGNAGGASIWYRWTAPSNMNAVVSTEGSSIDTVLAVYTGSSVNGLSPIVRNDDRGTNANSLRDKTSLTNFPALAGVTYRIAIDGYARGDVAQGAIQFNLNPAWNDNFARPVQVSGFTGSISGSSRGATRQAGEPLHNGVNSSNSVWYTWTSPTNGPFTFDTAGSSFDTLLAVYTDDAFPLTAVISDDNSGPFGTSRVTFTAVSNTTYRIAVDGIPGELSDGVVRLSWTGPRKPTILSQPVSTNLIAGSTARFTVGIDGSDPLHYQWRTFGTNILNDGSHISGANTATLTIGKIFATDQGAYSVVITNAYGAITSTPANLIVLDNPRVVYLNHVTAPIAGNALLPVHAQAVGDEHVYKFSMSFDSSVLSNPSVATGSNTPGASVTMNTSQLASGRIGVTLTLAAGQTLPQSSTLELARVMFDANPLIPAGTETFIGFLDQPVSKSVISTNGGSLTALFAAGTITIEDWSAAAAGQFLPDGTFRLSLNGPPNHSYAIEMSTNLNAQSWTVLATNRTSAGGALQFIDARATNSPQRFYRARMLQ